MSQRTGDEIVLRFIIFSGGLGLETVLQFIIFSGGDLTVTMKKGEA